MLPHTPFRYLPSGERYTPPEVDGTIGDAWATSPAAARVGQQRHLLQLGYTDLLLGRLMARLRANGVYDETAVVVVADHGASFRPGLTRRNATSVTLPDLAFVPFFFKAPHQRAGRVVDRHVRTVDVVPTLADALRVRVPWRHDGRSALRPGPRLSTVTLEVKAMSGPLGRLLRDRAAAVAAQARGFGTGGFDARFYALGGGASFIGSPTPQAGRTAPELEVDVAPADSRAWVTGRLSGPEAREGVRLAISVGGRIAGTATAYRADNGVVFALMLSPEAAAAGDGAIRVHRIHDTPLRLEELRTT